MGAIASAHHLCSGRERKGVKYDKDGSIVRCVFCDIVADKDYEPWREKGSDGVVSWFRSKAGDAEEHWLVVPCRHVQDVRDPVLDSSLLEHMVAVGKERGDILCFHRPPFNSIDHLHLHAFREPFVNFAKDLKHRPSPSFWKMWTLAPEDVGKGLLQDGSDGGSLSSSDSGLGKFP
uniref:HIT domain-containing protein n=1 Tax=Alexandrium catenella TaxID=2925 RepID=A0A7S1MNN8_ALECA|mmetsp:Transcript_2990/g.8062  ORF Transcript_2990/g.8062 Transcript_2990/m.8062 type:complete len:176 (+) Transcript_2990:43-570(+)